MTVGSGNHQRDVVLDGERRTYLIHIPKTYQRGIRLPAVVVLHGGGGSAVFASRVHGWQALSQREECLVIFPEAMPEDPAQQATFRENPRIWNDGSRRSAVARRNVDDIGYLAAVLDDVVANFSVDADRIFVTGFSNGALDGIPSRSRAFTAGGSHCSRLRAPLSEGSAARKARLHDLHYRNGRPAQSGKRRCRHDPLGYQSAATARDGLHPHLGSADSSLGRAHLRAYG